jgi:hypothetical protein
MAKFILDGKEMFQMVRSRNENLCSLDFWDYTALYYSELKDLAHLFDFGDLEGEELEAELEAIRDRLEDSEVIEVKDDVELPDSETTYGDRLVLLDRCFYWRAEPKYCSLSVETEAIMYEKLLEAK